MQLRADPFQDLLFVRQVEKVQYDALVLPQEFTAKERKDKTSNMMRSSSLSKSPSHFFDTYAAILTAIEYAIWPPPPVTITRLGGSFSVAAVVAMDR